MSNSIARLTPESLSACAAMSASRKCAVSNSDTPMPFSFGLAFGGGGGRGALGDLGGLRKSCASSGTLAPGTQSAIPSRQTSVSPLIAPEAASTPTSTRVSGPVSVSPSITYHMAAGTLGIGRKTVPPPVRVMEGGTPTR